MEVSEIMTKKPVTLKPNNNLKDVLEIFSEHKIEACPVLNAKKEIMGIVSHSDVLRVADIHSKIQESTSKTFPVVIGLLKGKEHFEALEDSLKKILTVPVSEFMTKTIRTVSLNDDVYEALRIMNKYKINLVPVVKDKKLVGVIARSDIIDALEKDVEK